MRKLRLSSRKQVPFYAARNGSDRAISRCNISVHRLFSSLSSIQPRGTNSVVIIVHPRPHRRARSLTHRGRLIMSPASRSTPDSTIYPSSLPVTSTAPSTSTDERLWKAVGASGVAAGRAISAADKMSLALAGHPPHLPHAIQPPTTLRPWVKQRENDSRHRIDIPTTKFYAGPCRGYCP